MKVDENCLTDWFSADVRPARVGVYQMYNSFTGLGMGHYYRYWDGKHWYYGTSSGPQQAKKVYDACIKSSRNQVQSPTKWRGLNMEPKSGK